MQSSIIGGHEPLLDGTPDAVEHVVAVRLHDDLGAGSRHFRQELAHGRLSNRVQVDLRVFNEQ